MAGEDQERFEDYLELEHFIEELQAGHAAHPPDTLTPSKASIYRMAALFRSASPEEAEPRPEFAAELQARLEQELQQPAKPQPFPFLSKKPQKKPRLSRRALLTGGAAAAAGCGGLSPQPDRVMAKRTISGRMLRSEWNATLRCNRSDSSVALTWHLLCACAAVGEGSCPAATVPAPVCSRTGRDQAESLWAGDGRMFQNLIELADRFGIDWERRN